VRVPQPPKFQHFLVIRSPSLAPRARGPPFPGRADPQGTAQIRSMACCVGAEVSLKRQPALRPWRFCCMVASQNPAKPQCIRTIDAATCPSCVVCRLSASFSTPDHCARKAHFGSANSQSQLASLDNPVWQRISSRRLFLHCQWPGSAWKFLAGSFSGRLGHEGAVQFTRSDTRRFSNSPPSRGVTLSFDSPLVLNDPRLCLRSKVPTPAFNQRLLECTSPTTSVRDES
jgi:hypothetical protein